MRTTRQSALLLSVLLLTIVCAAGVNALLIYHDSDPAIQVGEDFFVVSWTTDINSTSQINYGTDQSVNQQAQNNTPTRQHRIRVDGLSPNTQYYYTIVSVAVGDSKIDDNLGRFYKTFTRSRSDSTAPQVRNVTVDTASETQSSVRWITDEPATSIVRYGIGSPTMSVNDTALVTEHQLTIDTTKNKAYSLALGGCDESGNCATQNVAGFFTSAGGELPLNVSVPEYTRFNSVSITGQSIPGATVKLTVNGKASRAAIVGSDGTFSFKDVNLEGTQATLVVSVRDGSGKSVEKTFKVVSDNAPPILTITQGVPDYSADTTLTVSGTVNEPVTLSYGVAQDGPATQRVTDLKATKVTSNTVDLQWATVTDAVKYSVYRNGVRVAIVDRTQFTDSVSSNTMYKYYVAAISKSCKESDFSTSVNVQSSAQGLSVNITPQAVELECGPATQSIQASGQFTISIQVNEGPNQVTIEAKDKGGNIARIVNTTTVDTKPPVFLENNLNQLSPSYTQEVELIGKLNKQATVLVYLNNDKPIAVLTDKDGSFSKKIRLSRDPTLTTTTSGTTTVTAESGTGWNNKIKLEAVDLAGRKITVGPDTITYALCGFGSTFSIELGKPLPDVLTPRLLLQGVQQAGFTINASYRGGRELNRPATISIRPLTLSASESKKYDNAMVRPDLIRNPRAPGSGFVQLSFTQQTPPPRPGQNVSLGKQEAELSKHRLGECKVPGFGCVRLLYEIEVKASEKIPKQFGDLRVQNSPENFIINDVSQKTCVDIELQIDRSLELSQNIPKKFLDASIGVLDSAISVIDTILDPLITVGTYTTYGCMAMNGVLFGTFFSERLSCDFASIQGEGLIGVLKTALGTSSIRDVADIGMCAQVFGAEAQAAGTTVQGGTGGTSTVAIGDKRAALAACVKCQDAIARRKSLEQKMRVVCDRVACPSAPTLQTYIKDVQKQPVKEVKLGTATGVTILAKSPNAVQGKVYTGNSCAFKGQSGVTISTFYTTSAARTSTFTVTSLQNGKPVFGKAVELPTDGPAVLTPPRNLPPNEITVAAVADPVATTPTATAPVLPKTILPTPDEQAAINSASAGKTFKVGDTLSVDVNNKGIKDVYLDFLKHKKDKPLDLSAGIPTTTTVGATTPNCAGLHAANPECCGYEYYQEWGSACGIPGLLETFDEIKESTCLSAQDANRVRDLEESAAKAGTQIQCKSLFNSVAGFCEPGSGQPIGDTIPTTIRYSKTQLEQLAAQDVNEVYIRIEPVGAQNNEWSVVRGYIRKRINQQRLGVDKQERLDKETARAIELRKNKQTEAPGQYYLNAELDFVPDLDPAGDLTVFFQETDATRNLQPGQLPAGFAQALCVNSDPTFTLTCTGSVAKKVYQDIKNRMGKQSDKVYIVRPDRDGILRSTQCMCLPAVTSYLTFWRNVLGAVRNCFQTVKVTGDASAGVCQAVLSQYVCDMMFDVMSCFTQKYGTPGSGTQFSGRGGIGDVLGALSAAGGDMQSSINSRYGDTALWKSMFVERKLLHSVCAFAFTGTWDLDLAGVYQQTVNEIPIKSQGFLYPADRRFISYNPVTRPSGLPTFTYHFGVGLVAGEDLRYQLELKCSNNLRCEPRDGFDAGKCDCFGRTEQRLLVSAPELRSGSLKKNEILNSEVFFTLQGGDSSSTVRYDTAILSWQGLNPLGGQIISDKVEVPIHVIGQTPPNFCKFDPLGLAYRCDIGIGDYTGARFTSITPAYKGNSNAFTTRKPLQFEVAVNLQYPQNLQQESGCVGGLCPYTKFINYEIKNQQGQTVDGPLKPEEVTRRSELRIEANGETRNILSLKTIMQSDFTFQQTTTGRIQPATLDDGNAFNVEPIPGTQLSNSLVLVITQKDNAYSYEIFSAPSSERISSASNYRARTTPRSDGQWGWFAKSSQPLVGPTALPPATPFKLEQYGIQIVNLNRKLERPAEYLIPFSSSTQNSNSVCDEYKEKPAGWTAVFTMYDSTSIAGGSAYEYNALQPTVDPTTGEVQRITVPFSAVCAEYYSGAGGVVKACPSDPTQSISKTVTECYCGTAKGLEDANNKFSQDSTAKVTNCGLDRGDYCVYDDPKAPAGAKHCSNSPGERPAAQFVGPPAPTVTPPIVPAQPIVIDSRIKDLSYSTPTGENICISCSAKNLQPAQLQTYLGSVFFLRLGSNQVTSTMLLPSGATFTLFPLLSTQVDALTLEPTTVVSTGVDGQLVRRTATVAGKLSDVGKSFSVTWVAQDASGAVVARAPPIMFQIAYPLALYHKSTCAANCYKPFTDKLDEIGAKYTVKEDESLVKTGEVLVRIGGKDCTVCQDVEKMAFEYYALIESTPSEFMS